MSRIHPRTGRTGRTAAIVASVVLTVAAVPAAAGPVEPGTGVRSAASSGARVGRGALAGTATTATVTIGIGHNAMLHGYSASHFALPRGGTLRVHNGDSTTHTVTAAATHPDGSPLFDTTVAPGATVVVAGAGALGAGRYAFYCRIHPAMRATLTIGNGGTTHRAAPIRFTQPVTFPKTIKAARSTIAIQYAKQRIANHGRATTMLTYGGTYPGPTIRRRTGRATTVRFVDRAPRRAGRFSVHLHGDHHRSSSDGQPTKYLIGRGRSRSYRYPLRSAGRPVPPSFGFYHDHVMGSTSRNNWLGLQGMFIVDDGREAALGLPTGRYDRPLLISDRTLRADHSLAPVPRRTGMTSMGMTGPDAPPNDATVGNRVLVNGRYAPYFTVATHRYRLRLLNGSNFTSYDFALSGGRAFTQVGTGSSLLPEPVRRTHILLGPAQRADVVVDFRGDHGKRIVLRSIARVHRPRLGAGTPSVAIMQFRVRRRAHDHLRLRHRLEATPRIRVPKHSSATWNFGLGRTRAGATYWTVNGRPFDPKRIDLRVPLGSTQRWTLRNTSTVTHYIHLHEEQWHTILRDGRRPPAYERGLQDTWRLDPGETVVVAAKFVDYTGVFMIHCHMLDHEDDGMMAQFDIVRHRHDATPAGYFLASRTPGASMPAMPATAALPEMTHHHPAQTTGGTPSTSTLRDAALAAGVMGLVFLLVLCGVRFAARRRRSSRPGGTRAATRTAPTAG